MTQEERALVERIADDFAKAGSWLRGRALRQDQRSAVDQYEMYAARYDEKANALRELLRIALTE